ncbi:ethylene-responsive transcription factor-like protein At4g13040 isoform X2 [Telopea speciosissima]|nr:ethylene-responsive transcription factor-like protein At4g13040 isoform X2 [Telopea speciosissima]XP_043722953.1 ethylene-responsive transcription factor-like protein At4g13040 isoform X2 [Telopea speciosissima]
MVSIRRRRLLGFSTGICPFMVELPKSSEKGNNSENAIKNAGTVGVHQMPSKDVSKPKEINVSGSSSSKEDQHQQFSGQAIKRRKRHRRRKHLENQEPCMMRGVYFKNMKWQAAIKVDKKQIHLGTVGSQEEAARLYDRAAFMCGREPNFELSEEEKQELRQFNWDEFLTYTRSAITSKKHQRRVGPVPAKKPQIPVKNDDSDDEKRAGGFSASEDMEQDTSIS